MSNLIEVKVPDIGDFKDVPVIEVHVKPGDRIQAEDALVTLESDKATMDVPSSAAGVVVSVAVKVGDRVAEGTVVVVLESRVESGEPRVTSAPAGKVASSSSLASAGADSNSTRSAAAIEDNSRLSTLESRPAPALDSPLSTLDSAIPHASPSVRRFARELGVDLRRVKGSGPKGRILHEDVQSFVKAALSAPAPAATASGGALPGLLPWPQIDFAKFGTIETKPLSRIKKISGANLHRNWVMIPHVTNHEDADITELEALRVQLNKENEKSGVKLTMLAFLIKACVAALKKFPEFNASLEGENLVLKKYYHIGFAADTPNGLMVPVVKDADQKGIIAIAKETSELAAKAREGKLSPSDMQGGCFSISSLGGIGGTYFTPIINAPEVAILGVCKSATRPVWDGKAFQPKLILPLSLSWDHRVIDGASAARFNTYLATLLADFRRVLL